MSNFSKLEDCFRDTLGLSADADVKNLAYQDHPSWDSVAHMRLVAALETRFDIMLETDQILDMSSFTKAIDIIQACGVNLDA
ncbi:MAG: acyl carrier protein [Alphaproteobacteria bacterium]|nr:acyl carrier protein [Alphaproteobacteria bacterium]